MEITPKDYCIFIASHMSKPHRIVYLIECLKSLISQTMPIPIYLSISFENNDIENLCKNEFNNHTFIINCGFLNVCVRPEKHSQMKHFQLLSNEIGSAHKWVMFSDDDDTYEPNRSLHFAQYLINAQNQLTNNNELHLAGLYESTFNKLIENIDTNIGVIVLILILFTISWILLINTLMLLTINVATSYLENI